MLQVNKQYPKKRSNLQETLEQKLDLAKTHLDNGETVLEAARLAGFSSPNHLANQFKRHYNITPTQYQAQTSQEHIKKREMLDNAREYLLEGKSIPEAARLAGFQSRDIFADRFKRKYKLSPLRFQEQNTNESLENNLKEATEHLLNGTSVRETARLAGFQSQDQMARLFKDRYSKTPLDYKKTILMKRIEFAKQHLMQGKSVDEAARLSGFKKGNYLFNVFKNHTGMTPSEYRNQRYNDMIEQSIIYYISGMSMRDAALKAGFGGKDQFADKIHKRYGRGLKAQVAYQEQQSRLEQSKQHLIEGLTISEVANEIGYRNAFEYSANFRRAFSITPREYQRKHESESIHADEMLFLAKYYLQRGKEPNLASQLAGYDSISELNNAFRQKLDCTPIEYLNQIRSKGIQMHRADARGRREYICP